MAKEKKLLLDALKEMPVIQIACKKAGVSRATYYRWKQEDTDFSGKCDESLSVGIEFVNDMSESQKIQLIKEKKMPAIVWWDKHNNPKYGAKRMLKRSRVSQEKLSPEDEALFKKALTLSDGENAEIHDKHI